jgi:glycine/D-amino acid oxidase-like deaminating enzyme
MPRIQVDFLIAGQGLAGSLLAWHLLGHKQRIFVVDAWHRDSSSMVAAGLINPITGMRLVKSARLEILLPTALSLYRQLSQALGQGFYHPRPMLRLFTHAKDAQRWQTRQAAPEYRRWLGKSVAAGYLGHFAQNPLGGFLQAHAGYLDIPALLRRMQKTLAAAGSYRRARIQPQDCRITPAHIQWQDVRAKTLIFCDGQQARFNPWFSWLPFQMAKGEILTLQPPRPMPRLIIHRGRWLLPTDAGHVRFGANYDRQQLDSQPTAAVRETLLSDLHRLTGHSQSYRLLQHAAGIRPATADTQPFIGRHPRQPRLAIFNGFGSKGSLLIPHCASRFAAHLVNDAALPAWADIARWS